MPCRVASLLSAVLVLSALASSAAAQDVRSDDPPAHISFVDGAATLERDGQPDGSPANMPLLAGDRVRTEGGRLEILFADGSTLHLDAGTTVDFQSDDLVRLLTGRIRVSIPGPDRQVQYRIDAPAASVEIASPGEYRVTVLRGAPEPEVELAVLRGSAELVNDAGRTPLRAGQRAASRGGAPPSYAYAFNSAAWDDFDRWSETRRDQRLGVSAQYLPAEVRPYAASFDRNGAWRYEASYGHVWYPTVSGGWRPYRNGRWVTLRPYGWTWVGADPWDWPTHHYGRWGLSGSAWFWIPGRSWAPAWVSWAYAPGYVSWCPLGWNNRPVVQIVNVYGRGRDPWRAWTAVPERHFSQWARGRGDSVHRVAARDVDVRSRHAFVARDGGPDFRGYAVPRSSTPIRIAGAAPGRRTGSPVYTNRERSASPVTPGASQTMGGPPRATAAPPVRSDRSYEPRAGVDRPRAISRGDARESNAGARGAGQLPASDAPAVQGYGLPAARAQERLASPERVRGATARPRGDNAASAPAGVDNRATFGGSTGRQVFGAEPSRERRLPAPDGSTPYDARPRAVPRDHPAYRPVPVPAEGGTSSTPEGPRAPAHAPQNLPRFGGDGSPREAPVRRAPESSPDGGARAVPRADPRGERPGAGSHPGAGSIDRRGPAPERPAAPADGGRSRSGGRGR